MATGFTVILRRRNLWFSSYTSDPFRESVDRLAIGEPKGQVYPSMNTFGRPDGTRNQGHTDEARSRCHGWVWQAKMHTNSRVLMRVAQ